MFHLNRKLRRMKQRQMPGKKETALLARRKLALNKQREKINKHSAKNNLHRGRIAIVNQKMELLKGMRA